jgi:hypothetical protein
MTLILIHVLINTLPSDNMLRDMNKTFELF